MPVTAKLSLKFYEKLGEDVAAELVECSTPWTPPAGLITWSFICFATAALAVIGLR